MVYREALPFVKTFVEELSKELEKEIPGNPLTTIQKNWLCFCLMGILITNSLCWVRFEKASLGAYGYRALSWMFRTSRILWEPMLQMSVRVILFRYGITEGVLVTDDTDHQRAKKTSRIHAAYKVFDKKTGGYFNGQTLVILLLVTRKITFPVGFAFYQPDPKLTVWQKKEKRYKEEGITKKNRPEKPARDSKYPTKQELMRHLLVQFKRYHPQIKVNAHVADNLYGDAYSMEKIRALLDCQVIGALKTNQTVMFQNKKMSVEDYFQRMGMVKEELPIRGQEKKVVFYGSARLYVPSHKEKRFVVALRYEEEEEPRYLVATDLSWRTMDILKTATLRWLVEVFNEDLKSYEGWGQLAKQTDYDGSSRGLTLSLLLDHCLFLHPSQQACLKNKQPAWTVGSLLQKSRMESLLEFLRPLLSDEANAPKLQELADSVERIFVLRPSKKHLNGLDIGEQAPSPSLAHRYPKLKAA